MAQQWYTLVTQDLANLPDFMDHYNDELEQAKFEVGIKGSVQRNLAGLPGITEQRFSNLQEIEAVLNYLNIKLRKVRSATFKKYLENYNRALSSRDAERYVDGEDEVIDMESLVNEVALLRNRYLGIMKGLESKNFMMGHLVRLKTSGMEDFTI
jgi:hypothetical protein